MAAKVETGRLPREGSPWTGLWAVVAKEMADYLTGVRMQILEALIVLTAAGTVFAAAENLRTTVGQDRFLFLRLFTVQQDPLPAFIGFLAFLVPLIAIALAFDTVNGEFNRRTLSRVLAQPIYRDALLFGKFLAGLFTLTLALTAIWLLVFGLGLVRLGVPPGGEEVARSLLFLVATIFYGGVWMAMALLFSVRFRQPATAALAAIAVWLFFTVFWGMIAQGLAQVLAPVRYGLVAEVLAQDQVARALARVSPIALYNEIAMALLYPSLRAFGLLAVLMQFQEGVILGAPLPLRQSLLLIWPQMTGLIAATVLLFAVSYILFQRQEIRA
ncbi:MAG: ABC transporter permease [Chloroflexi bacterium]|jgi:ABC-2 type transport system permease protein|nr:ABC transporter permease [Chloroflexota bacterium]